MKAAVDSILKKEQAKYLETLVPERDRLLAEMERYAEETGQPIADPEVAQLIRVLLRIAPPKRVVEVGTNIGYSVVVMGRELGPAAKIETIEIDPAILRTARDFVRRADLPCEVIFHEGAALDVLRRLEGEVDFAFVDCLKYEYVGYLDLLLPHMKSGAMVVADNVLWKGQVAEGIRDRSTDGIREFNARISTDERLLTSIVPVGDGVSISVVR